MYMKKIIIIIPVFLSLFSVTAQQKQANRLVGFLGRQTVNREMKDVKKNYDTLKVVDSFMSIIDTRGSKRLAQKIYTPSTTSNSSFINDNANVSLESDFGDGSGSVSAAWTKRNFTLSGEVKQPFQEKPKELTPLSLDGLSSGTSVKLGMQLNFSRLKSDTEIDSLFKKIKKTFYLKKYADSIKIPCCDSDLITEIKNDKTNYYYKKKYGKIVKIDSLKKLGCCYKDSMTVFYLKDTLYRHDYAEINQIDFNDLDSASKADFLESIFVKTWLVNASASISKAGFDYIKDSFSINPVLDETHINKSYKLVIGRILNAESSDNMSVLALSCVYSKTFEDGSEPVDYNFPIGNLGASYSKKVSIGTPSLKGNTRLALEWRKKVSAHVAFSPSVSYQFTKKSLAAVLPVYIFQFKKDGKIAGLQGGLKLGYITQTNESKLTSFSKGFSAGVFIAAPFDLFSF